MCLKQLDVVLGCSLLTLTAEKRIKCDSTENAVQMQL